MAGKTRKSSSRDFNQWDVMELFNRGQLRTSLTPSVLISIIDECFKNGPVDLTDEMAWIRIQNIVNHHSQGNKPSIASLKHAWNDVIDGKLNELCQTNVNDKELWQGWISVHSCFPANLPKENISILSRRLKSVYDDRLARRGWTVGVDYKTLREEHEENSKGVIRDPVGLPVKNSGADLGQAEVPGPVHLMEWKMADLPTAFSSKLEGSHAVKLEQFTLPNQQLLSCSFLVLEKDGLLADSALSNVIRYLILIHGGKVVQTCDPTTIVVGSCDESYTAQSLREFQHYGKVVAGHSLVLAIGNISSSKPWELLNDLSLESQLRSNENPIPLSSLKREGSTAESNELQGLDPPVDSITDNDNCAMKRENLLEDDTDSFNERTGETHQNRKGAAELEQTMEKFQPNCDLSENSHGIKREFSEDVFSADFLRETSSFSEQEDDNKIYWKRCQQIFYAFYFKFSADHSTRKDLAQNVAMEFEKHRGQFEADGIVCKTIRKSWRYFDDHFAELLLPLSENEIQEAFEKINPEMKEKVGIKDANCVENFQKFVSRAKRNKKI